MGLAGRLILVFFVGILLSFQRSMASEIAYSIGPSCNENNEVICSNPNEVPTCIVLNPRVHVEYAYTENSTKTNRYSTVCVDSIPTCFDQIEENQILDDIVVECVEFAQCVANNDSDKPIPSCSKGKMAKCLGSENEPDCSSQASNICEKGVAVCDYTWQANLRDVPYQ